MLEQQPTATGTEPDGNADAAVSVAQEQQRRIRESAFTNRVIDEAHHHGWQPFQLRDRDSIHIVRGRGFPDLVMYRKDPDTGQTELLVAELKRGYDSELREEQVEWLEALGQHIPAYEWRPENWDEIERVLKDGPKPSDVTTSRRPRRQNNSHLPANFNVITCLAETIEAKEYSTGDRAQLRRMKYDAPNSSAFWKLMVREDMPANPDIPRWGLIVHGMALVAHGAGLAHNPRIRVGRALHEVYSEDRLSTLLAARGSTLHSLLARLFRMLANEGCSFNWREMARFILNEGYNESQADQSRVEIASAYYRAQYQAEQSSNSESN